MINVLINARLRYTFILVRVVRVYNLMTASTTVPLAVVVPVTVVTGSVKSMVIKFPTDEECFTYTHR